MHKKVVMHKFAVSTYMYNVHVNNFTTYRSKGTVLRGQRYKMYMYMSCFNDQAVEAVACY